jgi:sugar phosphate isomerase/epimerase
VRIGYNTWSLATVPYQAFIPRLAEIGYTAIAISVIAGYTIGGRYVANACDQEGLSADDRKRIKEGLRSRGFVLTSVVGNQPLLHPEAARVEAGLARLRASVELCTELVQDGQPVPTLNTGMGGQSGDDLAPLVDRLGALAEHARKSGVVVCVEPHVGQAVDTVDRSEWVVKQVASPYLQLDFDVSHFEVQCVPMAESVPRLAPLAAAAEIKDQKVFSARREDGGRGGNGSGDAHRGEGWIDGNGWGEAHGREFQFLLGGEGEFDLPGYLKLMQASGYSDPISFEASVQCQARPGYDGLAEAERTYRWMAAGWRTAGISTQ